jgi:uncharacterized repeat protein (TIGR01451 family)
MLAAALGFGSAAKSSAGKRAPAAAPRAEAAGGNAFKEAASPAVISRAAMPLAPAPAVPFQQASPSIETYNCSSGAAQNVFELGDKVCARATGVPTVAFPEFGWRVSWVDPAGVIEEKDTADVDTTTQYDYTLPGTDTSGIGSITVNNRGTWRATLTRANGRVMAAAYFTVRSTQRPVSDVYVQKFLAASNALIASGSPAKFIVIVANIGPNDAANVHVADSLPAGSSLASFSQVDGPQCTAGTSPQDCTMATLASGSRAEFEAIYIAGGPDGVVSTTATATTDTAELDTDNNTGTGSFEVTSAGGSEATCALECPNDVVTAANTYQGTTHGANVTFGSAEVFGSCGTVTANPSSGSFFPVGTTTVTVSSSAGGGSCSFSVTVTEDPAPSITCPAAVSATADSSCSAQVSAQDLGTPTTSGGTGTVTVNAARNDNQALDAPYPVGTTTITYTATDAVGRIASCTQTVTVTVSPANDTAPPTITAPPDVSLSTGTSGGACGLVVSEAQLGTAQATDDGCSVTVSRTGVPAGNFFPVGTTTVTWVATDAAGKTATATQEVTIAEDTPPSIEAPPDASYTCVDDVPAANPSQANGGDPNKPGGGPVTDNCGTPTVTVSETRSGVGNASSPLIIKRTFTATDASGNSASSVQTITVIDDQAPSLAIVGAGSITHECHTPFTDPGYNASDNCAGAVVVTTSGGFNPDAPGTYVITYTATDAVGNTSTAQRTVTVVDTTAPVITLNGAAVITHECHTPFTDPGASASDSCDSTVPVNAAGSVNPDAVGVYTITYTAADDSGNNAAPVTRTVRVVDTTAPTVALNGSADVTVECHTSYTELGASASDSCAGPVGVTTSGSVNVNAVGDYTLTYSATDPSGNTGTATRVVHVRDTTAPTVTLNGASVVEVYLHGTYTEQGATASDSCAGPVTPVNVSGSVNTNAIGAYVLTYSATDPSGNTGTATRTVYVIYKFTGFFSPIANQPTINQVNAGRSVPVKFNLDGNQGLSIFAANSPFSAQVTCGTNAPVSDVQDTGTAGSSSLSYDASSGQYVYTWKTESSWAGQCRVLNVKLNDGKTYTAYFKFK